MDLWSTGFHCSLMSEITTLKIDEQGRITVPQPVRQALGVDGKEAIVQVELSVRDVQGVENGA